MRNENKITPCLILLALIMFCAGCTMEKPVEVLLKQDTSGSLARNTDTSARFHDPVGPTPVESAMELSAKYAQKIEELAKLETQNQQLREENKTLMDRLAPCETRLTQAQKELGEANDLLIEMRIELNNWKTNILGFRDEIREADKAQLEALTKILTVLGGQTKTESALNPNDDSAATAPQDPNQPRPPLRAATSSGDFNG